MKKFFSIFIVLVCILGKNVFSLELTIPIYLYKPLSKTTETSMTGSSNIIIDFNELAKYKNLPIQNILDLESGIKSRSIYGSHYSGSKSTLDIRGMGAQAKSNVLILINGQRLNNIDMSEIDFPSIPIESIDRVEIIKGNAASVLYGDGAIGGSINIITSPELNAKNINRVIINTGSFNTRETKIYHSQKDNNLSFTTHLNHFETDGYRDENEQLQNNVTSEIRYNGENTDHFVAFNFSEQIMSTPGDRSQDQLYSDRRGSDTKDDFVNSIGGSILYSSDYIINENINFIINSSLRIKNSFSDLQSTSYPSYSDTLLTNYQLSPRYDQKIDFLEYKTNLTYGFDIRYADYKSYRKKNENAIPLHKYDAWESSLSFYTQNTFKLNNQTKFLTGFRLQKNYIDITDFLDVNAPDYAGWQTEHIEYSNHQTNILFNLGFDHKINNNLTMYSRLGNGFRYPNIDDRIGGSGGTSLDLNTQTSNDLEGGLKYNLENFFSNFSFYLIEGKNEIGYDADALENININSTRRYGIELNTKNNILDKLTIINNFTYAKAKYRSGDQETYATDFKGNDVPLVPQYSYDASLIWKKSIFTEFLMFIRYQSSMRMESDDENFQDTKIPNYFIANLSVNSKFENYYTNFLIKNIFDKKYHNYAVASSSTKGTYNAYPEPGREFYFGIGVNF